MLHSSKTGRRKAIKQGDVDAGYCDVYRRTRESEIFWCGAKIERFAETTRRQVNRIQRRAKRRERQQTMRIVLYELIIRPRANQCIGLARLQAGTSSPECDRKVSYDRLCSYCCPGCRFCHSNSCILSPSHGTVVAIVIVGGQCSPSHDTAESLGRFGVVGLRKPCSVAVPCSSGKSCLVLLAPSRRSGEAVQAMLLVLIRRISADWSLTVVLPVRRERQPSCLARRESALR